MCRTAVKTVAVCLDSHKVGGSTDTGALEALLSPQAAVGAAPDGCTAKKSAATSACCA